MPTATAPAMPRAMPRSRYPSTANRSAAHSQRPPIRSRPSRSMATSGPARMTFGRLLNDAWGGTPSSDRNLYVIHHLQRDEYQPGRIPCRLGLQGFTVSDCTPATASAAIAHGTSDRDTDHLQQRPRQPAPPGRCCLPHLPAILAGGDKNSSKGAVTCVNAAHCGTGNSTRAAARRLRSVCPGSLAKVLPGRINANERQH